MSVLSVRLAATNAQAIPGRCRLFGMWVVGGATNGSIVLSDSGTTNVTPTTIDVPGITTSGTTFGAYIPFPDEGLSFTNSLGVTITTAAACTIFYEQKKSA